MVLFDFDGSLSLIRTGWFETMVPMMVETLAELNTGESQAELRRVVEEFVFLREFPPAPPRLSKPWSFWEEVEVE